MCLTEDDAEKSLVDTDAVCVRLLKVAPTVVTAPLELQEHLAAAWLRKIEALGTLERNDDAVAEVDAFTRYFDQGADTPEVAWPWLVEAACRKVVALARQSELHRALEIAESVQARFEHTQALAVREWVAYAGLEETKLRTAMGETFARVDMVRHAQRLAERFGADAWPATRALVGRIRLRRARMLSELDYDDEALREYSSVRADFAESDDPGLQEVAADAMHMRSRLLKRLHRDEEARSEQRALLAEYAHGTCPGIRQTRVLAQFDAIAWAEESADRAGNDADHLNAWIDACDALILDHADSRDGFVVLRVNQALRHKARALRRFGDAGSADDQDDQDDYLEQADRIADEQWMRYRDHPDAAVQATLIDAMLERLDARDRPAQVLDEAELLLQHLQRSGPMQAASPQLIRILLLKSWALRVLRRPAQALETLARLPADESTGEMDSKSRKLRVDVQIERGRLLRQMERPEEALDALALAPDCLDEVVELGKAGFDIPLRRAVARALDLRIDILADATPSKEGGTPPGQAPLVPAEHAYAQAVHAFDQCFHADSDATIRSMVANALYLLACRQRDRLHLEEAIASYDLLLGHFAADTESAIEPRVASAYLNKAYLLVNELDRPEDALPVYDALMTRFASATSPGLRDTLAKGAASRLTCLNRLQDRGVAVNYGDQYEDITPAQRNAIVDTLDRADALRDEDKYRDAIALYDQMLTEHVESLHPELRRLCRKAMTNKAFCLASLNRRDASLEVNDEVIARYGSDLSTTAEKDVALAMSNKAADLDRLGRHDEELKVYEQIIERWAHADVAYLRLRVASAMFCRACTLADRDPESALAGYRQVLDGYLSAGEANLRLQAAKSAVNLGILLRKLGRHADALRPCERLLEACNRETDEQINAQLIRARISLARSYAPAGAPEKAVAMYRELLILPPRQLSETQRRELDKELLALPGGRLGLVGLFKAARGKLLGK
jgi:tetratricopeptide (TPR) repeat protein